MIFETKLKVSRHDSLSAVAPSDWTSFSDTNVKKSEGEKQASVTLKSVITGVLDQTYNDLVAQCKNVDLAFKKRVEECLAAKERLSLHLEKVIIPLFFTVL